MKTRFTSILFLIPFLFFISCKKDSDLKTGKVNVQMTDTTTLVSGFDEINVEVQKVEVRIAGSTGGDWRTIQTTPQVYNLLLLSGNDITIGGAVLPTGEIMQVRITAGNNNSVKKNGILYPMILPDAEKSKLTIETDALMEKDGVLNLRLNFDADESVVDINDQYYLHPVLAMIRNPQ